MKTILFLTFDYELPLGSLNASYQETLFNPTYKILEIAEKNNVKVTLFADVLGIDFFKNWDHEHFYKPCVAQLRAALERGHDVQLHLHPHWLTSKFENGKYQASTDFSLSEFSNKPLFGGIDGVIVKGINIINEICKPVNKNYSCVAFRGGDIIFIRVLNKFFHPCKNMELNTTVRWQEGIIMNRTYQWLIIKIFQTNLIGILIPGTYLFRPQRV